MRFVAKQPREGINVSDTHPLVEAGTLIIGLAAIAIGIVLAVIFLIELSLYFVSAKREAEIFASWLPEDFVAVAEDDARVNELQALVDRLAIHWLESPYDFRVQIDDSDQANAMALPGGLIIVTEGLLDQVESENELAFVLGHELGHFRNRDHLRALGRGIVLSLFFASILENDVAGIGIKAADLTLRGFSRGQETDADEFGLSIVNSEYGHVDESWRLFERWQVKEGSVLEFVTYLSTHPDSSDRISDMKKFAAAEGWRMAGEITPLSW